MIVAIGQPDPDAFAPFGVFVRAAECVGGRALYSDCLAAAPGLSLQFHANHVAASRLPQTIAQVERHPNSAQAFLPLGVERYLVTVMPSAADGSPDPARTISFLMPGNMGVIYRPNAWHVGATVLDRDGSFAVLMWRGGADDDVFATVPAFTLTDLQP